MYLSRLEEAGNTEKAADCYEAAIEIKPGFMEAQLCLSNIKKMRVRIHFYLKTALFLILL